MMTNQKRKRKKIYKIVPAHTEYWDSDEMLRMCAGRDGKRSELYILLYKGKNEYKMPPFSSLLSCQRQVSIE